MERKQYGMIDITKFIFALGIVSAHFITEYANNRVSPLIEYASSLYVIIVPFFFTCSGFLLFSKITKDNKEKNKTLILDYIMKIGIKYLCWSAIYIIFVISKWMRLGATPEEISKYFINLVTYSSYKTIWFLPALIIGVFLTYTIYMKLGKWALYSIAVISYVVGSVGVSYSFLLLNSSFQDFLNVYNYYFVSTRNGFFNAFPFITLGFFIAKSNCVSLIDNNSLKKRCIFGMILFGILFVSEAFLIKKLFDAQNVNTLFFLVPFTYCLFVLCINTKVSESRFCLWARRMSTLIFLCQRLFLTAIPELFPEGIINRILNGNPVVAWFVL